MGSVMKPYFNFFVKVLPFTAGIIFTLISLSFLVEFIGRGLDFDDEAFFVFIVFAVIGIPTLLFGLNKASSENL